MPELRPINTDLLNALRLGTPSALASVYETYGAMVYRVARKFTGNDADAEDVLQDVFIGLPEAMGQLRSPAAFEPWLKRIAVRAALMRNRSVGRSERRARDFATSSPGSTVPEEALDRLRLEQAIDKLPESLRQVFVLRGVEGFSHYEIAEVLHISERASQQRMHRARARLRLLLGSR